MQSDVHLAALPCGEVRKRVQNCTALHTPGPWTMQTVRTSCGVCFKVGPFPWKHGKLNHACIYADYPGTGPEYHELVANARLIAAAPDLLEALREILADGMHCDVVPHLHRKACAAIAKATGAQHDPR